MLTLPPPQKPTRNRSILFITSVSAEMASPERADYCVSKAGAVDVGEEPRVAAGRREHPVFEMRPGIIRTDMTACGRRQIQARIETVWCRPGAGARGRTSPRWPLALAGSSFGFATGSVIACDGALSMPRL